jgi:hypothetical protein
MILENKPTHKLWADMVQGVAFLHLNVYNWNSKVLRQMDARWKEICDGAKGAVYVRKNDRPSHKFLKRFGFEFDHQEDDIEVWKKEF